MGTYQYSLKVFMMKQTSFQFKQGFAQIKLYLNGPQPQEMLLKEIITTFKLFHFQK